MGKKNRRFPQAAVGVSSHLYLGPLEKKLLWLVKGGLFIIPLLPLYVSRSLQFPFITGRSFLFFFIVELVVVFWVVLLILNPQLRPRFTPVFWAVTAFVGVIFFADIFGVNPALSLFSTYERMDGFLLLFHLFLYFLMLISILRTQSDWVVFFNVTIGVAIVIGFLGVLQRFGLVSSSYGGYRVHATMGNATHLAGYLYIHLWLSLLLLYRYWERLGPRVFYGYSTVFILVALYLTGTRGALVSLFITGLIFLALAVIRWDKFFTKARQSYRIDAAILLLGLILVPLFLWFARETEFVKSIQVVNRINQISLTDATTVSRFLLWGIAMRGVGERPVLGWGQENFNIVFQNYFDPRLFASDDWIDRVHNAVFDWMVAGGLVGLFSYLTLFGVSFWTLYKVLRRDASYFSSGVFLMLALLGYFLQNLFTFDTLNSYIVFFATLAYVNFVFTLVVCGETMAVKSGGKDREGAFRKHAAFAVGAALAIVFVFSVFFFVLKPLRQTSISLKALVAVNSMRPIAEIKDLFKKSISVGAFGTDGVREVLGGEVINMLYKKDQLTYAPEEFRELVNFTVEELEPLFSRPQKDLRHVLMLAIILAQMRDIDENLFMKAEPLFQEAIRESPRKQATYYAYAEYLLLQQRVDEAVALLTKGVELEPKNQLAVANLIYTAKLYGKEGAARGARKYLDIKTMREEPLTRIGAAYFESGETEIAREIYAELVRVHPENAKYHGALATVLASLGENERAREEFFLAAGLDPQYKEEAKQFLKTTRY